MTDTTNYTIAAQTEQGAVVVAEVTHTDLTEGGTTGHGTIEHIDPNEIQVETNVRTIVKVDPALVASIREFGVLEPVVCRRSEDGTVSVRMGQRRVLAAREAGRATVPAYIVEGDDSTVTRLVEQFAENEHRADLTEPERAAVFQQLSFEGLSVPQIAKQTGVKKAVVEAGIKVAESEFAAKIATKHEVTLDQAAALIEFEGDKEAVARLVGYAEDAPEQFAHELQRQRDNRARAEVVAAECAKLTEAGFTILESRPDSYYDKERISIRDLVTAEGEPVTVEDLATVTPKFAHVRSYYTSDLDVAYFVTDPKGWGFKKVSANGNVSGGMNDEQKAERKTLIANNKAWDSAEVVRREWLATFLSRKTLPKDATAFVAVGLTRHRTDVASALAAGNRFAAVLLGLPEPEGYWSPSPVDTYAEQPGKAAHATLAIVLAGMELATGRYTWRNPSSTAVRYFAQLAAWGYPLSEVEQIVVDAKTTPGDEHDEPEGDDAEDFDPGE
jgi:ParB family chromosome partitioning protein